VPPSKPGEEEHHYDPDNNERLQVVQVLTQD
jgi:hypothetical protein